MKLLTKRFTFAFLIAMLIFAIPAFAQDTTESGLGFEVDAHVVLTDAEGTRVGSIRFLDEADYGTVAVLVQVNQMPPGFHGFQIHQVGQCDADGETAFESAGENFDLSGDEMNRSGDMPPILVLQDGTGSMSFRTDRFMTDDLFDEDGSAIIVHENLAFAGDDPGTRLACGVIAEGDVTEMDMMDAGQEGEATVEPGMEGSPTPDAATEMDATPVGEVTEEAEIDVDVEATVEVDAEVTPETTD